MVSLKHKKLQKKQQKKRFSTKKYGGTKKSCSCHTRRRRRTGKKHVKKLYRGGGIIPQDMVNLGRGIMSTSNNLVSSYKGLQFPPSYLPTVDHPINNNNVSYLNIPLVDVTEIRQKAINSVLK